MRDPCGTPVLIYVKGVVYSYNLIVVDRSSRKDLTYRTIL